MKNRINTYCINLQHLSSVVTLYEKIHELEEKKQSLVDEANSKGTPAEEREKLLKQVHRRNSLDNSPCLNYFRGFLWSFSGIIITYCVSYFLFRNLCRSKMITRKSDQLRKGGRQEHRLYIQRQS